MHSQIKSVILKAISGLYKDLDDKALKAVKATGTTCTPGCVHCCKMLVCAMLPEGLLIADHIAKRHDWMFMTRKLARAAKKVSAPDVTIESYFQDQIPCVFLDQETHLCSIYDVRPSACRYYYSGDPPEFCSIDNPTKEVAQLDLVELEAQVWKLSGELSPGSMPVSAPLPLMVLFCLGLALEDPSNIKFVRKLTMGIPDPHQWMESVGGRMNEFRGEQNQEVEKAVSRATKKVGLDF